MYNLTLIIPAKNEKESLPKVLTELDNKYKIKVVLKENDYETIEAIKNFNIEIIKQTGDGFGNALIEGINAANTKYFSIFNADGSFEPKELDSMMKKIEEGYDFVFGSRYMKNSGSEDDTIITYIGNKIFTLLGNIFFNLKISDILYTFVIGKTNNAQKLNLISNDFSFCVELPIKAKRQNNKLISTPSFERKRIAGKKKVNAFKDGSMILIKMIKLFFQIK
jgi:glycosyltransferase involved in cell wall biosynthesis